MMWSPWQRDKSFTLLLEKNENPHFALSQIRVEENTPFNMPTTSEIVKLELL